jgi:CDP-glycerol glycerophosphotransferase (TagB/SpsB family)
LFSIVVPVHNVRAYLRECLDSLQTQSFGDYELIAVDDASTDGCGEILDEYAGQDGRIRVLHLAANAGLGGARNAGMGLAAGNYVLFLDSDDTLVPGSLQAIADRLYETGIPDILVYDYARTYWTGSVERNVKAPALAQDGSDVFAADERPDVLRMLMVVWNKAYRREFLDAHGFRFPPGYYEDLPWTYPTMISAERIAVLDRVCVHYRQRRHGNILRSQSRKHFDVFDQYDRVFAYLDEHPELERWRTFLFERMLLHLLTIVRAKNRVDPSLLREFFDAFVTAHQRHAPVGYDPRTGPGGAKLRAVAANNHALFAAAESVGGILRAGSARRKLLEQSARRRTTSVKRSLIRKYYAAQLHRALDENLAVYASYWARDYSCNPKAIYEAARELTPHIRGVWVVKKENVEAIPPGVDYVKQGSREYFDLMARAKYFVNNVNFPTEMTKRPGQVHIQTNHGTPLKTMGMQLQDYPVGANGMSFGKLLQRCDRWDYLISSNRYSSEIWERAYPCDYVTLETGYPRNDRLARATTEETARIRSDLGLDSEARVILYAPTFRDWMKPTFTPQIDLARLCNALGKDYVIIVRGHYLTRGNEEITELQERGLLRDGSKHPVLEDLMIASDALLTDYSSIMFDYAILDRPIVVYAEDWDTYTRVRGVNFDLTASPPGTLETTMDGLVDAFTSGRYAADGASALRAEFRKRFCQFDDGHAAERVVRMTMLGRHEAHE